MAEKGPVSVSESLGKSKTLNLPGPSARLSDLLLSVRATRPPLPHTTVAPPVGTEVGSATAEMGRGHFQCFVGKNAHTLPHHSFCWWYDHTCLHED